MPATEIGPSEALLEELRLWVEHETPTSDPASIILLMDEAERGLRGAGGYLLGGDGRPHFRILRGDEIHAVPPS